ncbi:hypothetical protein D0T12_13675 [Actinomadura spongiicola]|uniref:Uncharacterized protein n=1 Tax=Actinomadura spongiicola TaxID=2303421 RepID=A0A372GGV6_9ACTN|nr:hypothetical protein D0T12_13675 [Actinomadura spongiicola]
MECGHSEKVGVLMWFLVIWGRWTAVTVPASGVRRSRWDRGRVIFGWEGPGWSAQVRPGRHHHMKMRQRMVIRSMEKRRALVRATL